MRTDALSRTMLALGHPTRRAILEQLRRGEATVAELAAPFDLTLPAVSKHLKVLRAAGLISQRRAAQRRPCRLSLEPLRDVDRWIGRYRRAWDERLDRLSDFLAETAREESPDGKHRGRHRN